MRYLVTFHDFEVCETIRTGRSTRGFKTRRPFGPKGRDLVHPSHPVRSCRPRIVESGAVEISFFGVSPVFSLCSPSRGATHQRTLPLSAAQPLCPSSRPLSSPSRLPPQTLKRSATPLCREMTAKKAKGIERKLPWSFLDRLETQAATIFGRGDGSQRRGKN